MIIIPVKEGESIDRALKRYKRKYEKTGVVKELRERQKFTKPSVIKRAQRLKAIYVQKLRQAEENIWFALKENHFLEKKSSRKRGGFFCAAIAKEYLLTNSKQCIIFASMSLLVRW